MQGKISLITRIGKIAKRITGIKDFSLFRKNLHKNLGKIVYRKKYSTQDIITIMKEMGMTKGSVVCIHSSMKEFYNFTDTAEDLIKGILDVITPEGTLLMPAYPLKTLIKKDNYVFNMNDKTGAGYLAETFRKYSGVQRSINVQHSVCAIGKHAEWLLKDHHRCHDCWDKDSPWQRMIQLNGLVFNFGLPRSYMGTFHHCVESILQYEHPYWAQFFTEEKTYKYLDKDNNVQEYSTLESNLDRRTKKRNVTKYFTNKDWQIKKISNLEIKVYYMKHCFPKMLNLGRKGICVYYHPDPRKFSF